jgi:uncharacterized protein
VVSAETTFRTTRRVFAMPMPPQVQMRLIKESLIGKESNERIKVLNAHLEALPGFYQGPYGKIRRWVLEEIERSRGRMRVRHQDTFAVPKEGDRQVGFVGAPNAGKSALLQALSGVQVRVAGYPFATLKPVASVVWIRGGAFQLVEIPGILPGAGEDRGGGRALLGIARNADVLLYIASLGEPREALEEVLLELELAGLSKQAGLCLSGVDLPGASGRIEAFLEACPDLPYCAYSSTTGEGLDGVRDLVWSLSGLISVRPRRAPGRSAAHAGVGAGDDDAGGDGDERPFALDDGATVADLAARIHKDFPGRLRHARVWGPSAKFEGQIVGSQHRLADGDEVELALRKG